MKDALEELYILMLKSDPKERFAELDAWNHKWVEAVTTTQYVINKAKITPTDHDVIVTHLATQLVTQLLESKSLMLEVTDRRYHLTGLFLKQTQKPIKI